MKAQKLPNQNQKISPQSQKGSAQKSAQPKKQKKLENQFVDEDELEDEDLVDELGEMEYEEEDHDTITDKEFYKAMQKLKDRGSNAVPPKKSASAYIIFGKEKRAEILKRNPLAKVTEVVKEIALSWGVLNKEERQKYKEAAKRDKERYEKELRSLESFSEKLKKPKKCLSAYMIFVKETRPKIVETHPEMGALQVMQEVGKKWQSLTKDERTYFKQKADKDKVRYLKEQKAFYDEVEKIGQRVGTVTSKEGQVAVNSMFYQNDQSKFQKQKPIKGATLSDSQQILQKRKMVPTTGKLQNDTPQKRLKNSQEEIKEQSSSKISMFLPTQPAIENKPKKPLSAYIYFSQEFREIIRQRFPFLTVAQIMRAVSFRWSNLTKEQKLPFESIAIEDKQRYDREVYEYKKGLFMGRSQTPSIRISSDNENVSTALEISDDLLQFLQVKTAGAGDSSQKLEDGEEFLEEQEGEEIYGEEIEEDQDMKQKSHVDQIYSNSKNLQNSSLKVVIENMDESQIRNRKDSLINPIIPLKIEQDEQPEIVKDHNSSLQQPQEQSQFQFGNQSYLDHQNKLQIPIGHAQQLQACLGGSFQYDGGRGMLQNELVKRESERKTSMNFGFGGFYPSGNITQSPAFNTNILNSPMMQLYPPGNGMMADDPVGMGYFMSGQPFQLPPSNHQLQQPMQQQQQPQNNFLRQQNNPGQQTMLPPQMNPMKMINSPQLNPASIQSSTNPQMYVNQYLSTQPSSNDYQSSSLSPFLAPQNPQQLLFPQFSPFASQMNPNQPGSNQNMFR